MCVCVCVCVWWGGGGGEIERELTFNQSKFYEITTNISPSISSNTKPV